MPDRYSGVLYPSSLGSRRPVGFPLHIKLLPDQEEIPPPLPRMNRFTYSTNRQTKLVIVLFVRFDMIQQSPGGILHSFSEQVRTGSVWAKQTASALWDS